MSNRIAVVVGGSSGIGEATCLQLAADGWKVIVADVALDRAQQVAQACGGAAVACDVRSAGAVRQSAAAIERDHGPVEALVMCAAVFEELKPLEDKTIEEWDRVVEVGYRGTYLVNAAFAPRMAGRGRGAIVNLSTYGALISTPAHAYGSMKAAVTKISENMAGEWGRSGIRVNTVSPGTTLVPRVAERIRTGHRYAGHPGDYTALGRLVETSEVVAAIAFLVSDRASGITGINLVVDAGALVAQGWAVFGGVPPARPRQKVVA